MAFFVFTLLMTIAGYLYLHSGPIDLALLKPRAELALTRALPGIRFTIGSLSAERDAFRREVIIKASNVRAVSAASGALDAFTGNIENVTVVLPQNELFSEAPKPKTLLANGLRGTLKWDAAILKSKLQADNNDVLPRLYWPAGLGTLRIENAEFKLLEIRTSQQDILTLSRLQAKAGLLRSRHIDLDVSANLTSKNSAARFAISGTGKAIPRAQWDVKFDISAVQPQRYAALFATNMKLPQVIPRISGTINMEATDKLRSSGRIMMARGSLVWQDHYARPLSIKSMSAKFVWQHEKNKLTLKNAKANVENVALSGNANINTDNFSQSQITAQFSTLSTDQLKNIWPRTAAPGGEMWFANNISVGTLSDGKFEMLANDNALQQPDVKLTFAFKDLQAEYRRPMPPVVNANGIGILNNIGLNLNITSGKIGGLPINNAVVRIGPFSETKQFADIDAELSGDLTKLMLLIDSKPLQYISKFGQEAKKITGSMSGKLKLRIPLTRDVSFDEISLTSFATTQNAQVPDIYGGKPLKNADLTISVTNQGLNATGTARLGTIPLNLIWNEDFTGKSPTPTQYDVSAQTTVVDVAGIGIDLTNFGTGPVAVQMKLGGRGGAISDGTFFANLNQATLQVSPFGVVKPSGTIGQISGSFTQMGRTVIIKNISLSGPAVTAEITAKIPLDAGQSEYSISNFKYGKNWLKGKLLQGNSLPVELNIEDGELDLRAPLTEFYSKNMKPSTPSLQDDLAINIKSKVSTAFLMNDVVLKNIEFNASSRNNQFNKIVMNASINNRAPLSFDLGTSSAGRLLELHSEDAGLLAKGLDLMNDGQGGIFTAKAELRGAASQPTIYGNAKITKFRLQKVPTLAKVLTIASLVGLSDTLNGRGIEFRKIELPFTLKNGIVDVRDATAIGPGLGLTLTGQVARASGQINMRGTIVPSYTLNSAAGKIPLVGKIIVGGKNQGLIGFNYRIVGTMKQPKINVVRSSGLAPGFLRRLFDGKAPIVESTAGELNAASPSAK